MSGNHVICHESQIQLVELYVHNLNHCNGHLIVLCHSDLRLPVKDAKSCTGDIRMLTGEYLYPFHIALTAERQQS